jgi:putative acyl-CoA dehydrogenase
LDVLRAFGKSDSTRDAVLAELSPARGLNQHFDAAFEQLAEVSRNALAESAGRGFAQRLVVLTQASLLLRTRAAPGSAAVAEGFCATRLNTSAGWGAVFGAGSAALDAGAIVARAWTED